MIKVGDALVAEFAVHALFRHGDIADPTVFQYIIGWHRIGLSFEIELVVDARQKGQLVVVITAVVVVVGH